MFTINAQDFTTHLQRYIHQLNAGIDLTISTAKEKLKALQHPADDTHMTQEDFYAMLKASSEEGRAGRVLRKRKDESMSEFLHRMTTEEHV